MKKIIAMLLALVMILGLAACSQTETPAGTTEPKPSATTPATTEAPETTEPALDLSALPLVEPGSVTMTIGVQQNATVLDYVDNYFTKYIEEQTGVKLDFVFFSSDAAEAKQQLNLMIAGNEKLPDIIQKVLDDNLRAELGADGYLVDQSEYLDTLWYYGKKHFDVATEEEKAFFWNKAKDPDSGAIYAYPSLGYTTGSTDVVSFHAAINSTFAKKFNMDPAEIDTIDELHDYLYKAVHEDGNGNGEKDEIGLVYRQKGYRANAELWIINAYVYCHDSYFFNATNGKLWVPYTTDEYRQAMITMNNWYKEELISPLAYSVASDAEMKALVETPDCYKVAAFGGHPSLVCSADVLIANDYTNFIPLQDETGKGGYGPINERTGMNKIMHITSDCENPDVAFRLIDFLVSDYAMKVARYGEEGYGWEYIDGKALGVKDLEGNWAGFKILNDEWSKETKQTWHQGCGGFGVAASQAEGLNSYGEVWDTTPGNRLLLNMGNLRNMLAAGVPDEVVYSLFYNAEESETVSEVSGLLLDYIRAARAEFVTGVKDPSNDADWDAYLAEMDKIGLQDYLEAAQSAYDRQNG